MENSKTIIITCLERLKVYPIYIDVLKHFYERQDAEEYGYRNPIIVSIDKRLLSSIQKMIEAGELPLDKRIKWIERTVPIGDDKTRYEIYTLNATMNVPTPTIRERIDVSAKKKEGEDG